MNINPANAAAIVRSSPMESSLEPRILVTLYLRARNPSMASEKKLSASNHLNKLSSFIIIRYISTGAAIIL